MTFFLSTKSHHFDNWVIIFFHRPFRSSPVRNPFLPHFRHNILLKKEKKKRRRKLTRSTDTYTHFRILFILICRGRFSNKAMITGQHRKLETFDSSSLLQFFVSILGHKSNFGAHVLGDDTISRYDTRPLK